MPQSQTQRRIVVLTGAGVSKESGLETFRDADGIWARVSLQDVATPEAYRRDPERVLAFYNERRRQLLEADVQPNPAHRALARLEREWAEEVLLVTQNIDDLHKRAGSRNLIHMHGEILKVRCTACGAVREWRDDVTLATACPACAQPGRLRPHVVWFGEMPFELERVFAALKDCALFLSVGTSGAVHPAAGFVQEARVYGRARTVELNLEPSEGSALFHEHHYGPASKVVPAYVERLLRHGLPGPG